MAQPKDRGTSRCIVCGGWLGFHPLRTKEGSICGKVDEKHANYLLDVPPDPDGLISGPQLERLREIGALVRSKPAPSR